MKKNSSAIIIGGMPFEIYGRALGPYRVRTICEREGYSASVIDCAWAFEPHEFAEILDYVVGADTLIVGFSCTWRTESQSYTTQDWINTNFILALKSKYPHVNIVLGVSNVSRLDTGLMSVADWIVSGFSEDSLPKLLNHLSGLETDLNYSTKKIQNKELNFINGNSDYIVKNMDLLETVFDPLDYFEPHQPLTIETCRGCVFSCAYCTYPFLGKKTYEYIRSVESMAAEFRRNFNIFGTTRYIIADDTFNDSLEKISRVKEAVRQAELPNFEFVSYIRPELLHIKPAMIPALIDLGLKGAFFGIESFKDEARKAVGRSTPIKHVLDAIKELKSQGDVRTHASMIVGLPGDTREDILNWKHNLISGELFNSWGAGPLILSNTNLQQTINFKGSIQSEENRSAIEKDPAKYKYSVSQSSGRIEAHWRNDHMSFQEAKEIASQLHNETDEFQSVGGWTLGSAWYHGATVKQIANPKMKKLDSNKLGMLSGKERTVKILENIRSQLKPIYSFTPY